MDKAVIRTKKVTKQIPVGLMAGSYRATNGARVNLIDMGTMETSVMVSISSPAHGDAAIIDAAAARELSEFFADLANKFKIIKEAPRG